MSKTNDTNYQTVISVGIDIGTTTTQIVVSRITIRNTAPGSSVPRMEITDKEVVHRSKIYFTPLRDHQIIDADAVAQIVLREYREAGLTPEQVDTGAVIVTGETAKKENAKNIVESMAGLAGDFVVATAGVNLESVLAGKGSGAAAHSREKHSVTLNIDIGGGTSNIGVFKNGQVIETACLNIGGHLIEVERQGDRITYISEPARAILRECGLSWQTGDMPGLDELKSVARLMAKCIIETITTENVSSITGELLMTPPLRLDYRVDSIMFSGGVADFIYGDFRPVSVSQVSEYGDIGPLLGWAVKEELSAAGIVPEKPGETIRATVIGAGAHSVDISGSTITVDKAVLPIRNVTVVSPFVKGVPESPGEITTAVHRAAQRIISDGSAQFVAFAMAGPAEVSFAAVQELAQGIAQGAADFISRDKPLIVVVEKDCAKILGQCLKIILGDKGEVVCIDQIVVGEGDYIDIGKPIMGGRVVPVVVKTLVFENTGARKD
ncbi:MAG: ethanolamine ammonia lyase-activating protein [Firmicutes bacterium HGW-Firmicutes-14]|nr:MAG: ethanolamine ammonia lyase-activating protein [Firmicutes bacterium HGW-Firmicutes-14]